MAGLPKTPKSMNVGMPKPGDDEDQVSRSPAARRTAAAKNTRMVKSRNTAEGNETYSVYDAQPDDLEDVDIREVTKAAKPGMRMRIDDQTTRKIDTFKK